MNSKFNENTDNDKYAMTKTCYTHKIKVAENTLGEAYDAVNVVSHLKSSIKKGTEEYIYAGFMAVVKDTALTTSEFEAAIKINYDDIMKVDSIIPQDLSDKFVENFQSIMRFSAYTIFLASILREALASVQNAFLGGDDFGNSVRNFIKIKLTEMHNRFGSASANKDYDTEIENLALIAKAAAEREKLKGEKNNAGQEDNPLSITTLSPETAIASGAIAGVGAIALGATIAGKVGGSKIASTVVEGTLSVTEGVLGADVNPQSNSSDTLQGISSLESPGVDDISSVAEQSEDSTGSVTTESGPTETDDSSTENDSLSATGQTSEISAAVTTRSDVLKEMHEHLKFLRKNIAALKESISKSAKEADHAYKELKEITGRRMVYGDNIYNTARNKQAFIKYASRNEEYRRFNVEYYALKDLEKTSISLIEKLEQGISDGDSLSSEAL